MGSRAVLPIALAAVAVGAAVTGVWVLTGRGVPEAVGPPGFPDLAGYRAVDAASYRSSAGGEAEVVFSTRGGVECRLPEDADRLGGARCSGLLPGLPETADSGLGWTNCPAVGTDWGSSANYFPWYVFHARSEGYLPRAPGAAYHSNPPCRPSFRSPILEDGQRISAAHITCAVGPGNQLSCIDPVLNRGFVLTPAGSWTF
ncbi:hypothetical protein KIH27_08610 [Mycobacterium sp. M1]|uniref:Uncharacterized protein n=1 Tax=Mycolicibacter acidiphilus TaxID=2835306 RepID=A0ABS5RH93_9MYCO|nr:hypothetical protein [Mycolicibacter acidiphilus]MBS9533645.1 hypothetical protein [Mycolicibacter acidiphilus]